MGVLGVKSVVLVLGYLGDCFGRAEWEIVGVFFGDFYFYAVYENV